MFVFVAFWVLLHFIRSVVLMMAHTHAYTHTHPTASLSYEVLQSEQLWQKRQEKEKRASTPEDTWLHESFKHLAVIFLPYRFRVEFAFATDSRPFLLLFQYVRALFEWGHPLPIWPGASLTSADLIESTTWVKFKQAETALPWQPHYSTLRTHFKMHCDFGLDKWWKGMKSNKWVHFWKTTLEVLWLKIFQYCTCIIGKPKYSLSAILYKLMRMPSGLECSRVCRLQ